MVRRLYLHIGIGKTGSTTIQTTLEKQRKKLASCGYLFPISPGRGHAKLAQISWSDEEMVLRPYFRKQTEYETPAALRSGFISDFKKEITGNDSPNVIISNETLHMLPDDKFDSMIQFLRTYFTEIRIIIFLRRQDEFLASYYKQCLVSGAKLTFDAYVEKQMSGKDKGQFAPILDFAALLDRISNAHPDIKINAILYHRELFRRKGLLKRFFEAIDLLHLLDEGSHEVTSNKSIDAIRAEYLRRYNIYNEHNLPPGILIKVLKELSSGQDIAFEPGQSGAVMDSFRESNERTAKKYLQEGKRLLLDRGREKSGILACDIGEVDLRRTEKLVVDRLCELYLEVRHKLQRL